MKKTLLAAVVACVMFAAPGIWGQTARDAGRRRDLDFVANQLPKLHPNFFFQLNPADYTKAVQALDAQVPNLTDAEFNVRLAALAAMARDEHTSILPIVAASSLPFPLLFRWLDDGVFVTGAAAEYSKAVGAQLVRVGESPIDDVMQQLGTVIPHANLQWLHYYGALYLRYPEILQGMDILPAAGPSKLTFRNLAGELFTLEVIPGTASPISAPASAEGVLPLWTQNTSQNYWYTYVAPLHLLYFKYNRCVQTPGNPFATFAAGLLNTLDTNPVDTLVIDFRGNTGGDSSIINSLVDGLGQRFATLYANPNFVAYDVIDKSVFSSGVLNAMLFKSLQMQAAAESPGLGLEKRLYVIGEASGGSPSHYGNVTAFTLPNSQLTGQYSTKFFALQDYIPAGPSFLPDIAIPMRSTDFFARYDPVLAGIVAKSAGSPPAPSGNAIAVNGASFRVEHGLAPGSFASVFGVFPDSVDGVVVNGQAGRVVGTSTAQVNFVMPTGLTPGPATISVRAKSTEVASGQATITTAGPGIFVAAASDAAQPGAVLNQDSTLSSKANPAAGGTVVQIFATGYGPLDSAGQAAAHVYFDTLPADVLFSGPIAQFPGLWQINARVPSGVAGQVPVFVVAGNLASNAVTLWVK